MPHLDDLELVDYADGDSDVADDVDVQRHLDECGLCRHRLEEIAPPLQASGDRLADIELEIPTQLVSAFTAESVPAVASGQLWQLQWEHTAAVALVLDVSDAGDALVVPAEPDPDLGDDRTFRLRADETSFDLAFALWAGLAAEVSMRVFNVFLCNVPDDAVETVRLLRSGSLGAGVGPAITNPLDPRSLVRAGIEDRFEELVSAGWLPETAAAEPVDLMAMLRTAGLSPSAVADTLAVPPGDALRLLRGQRAITDDEVEPLADVLHLDPSRLAGHTPAVPESLVIAIDDPRSRSLVRRFAKRMDLSDAQAHRTVASEVMSMAARTSGRAAEPDWGQLVQDFLRA